LRPGRPDLIGGNTVEQSSAGHDAVERETDQVTTVAVIGAGRLDSDVARLAVRARYRVLLGAAGDPSTLDLLVGAVAPGATPSAPGDACRAADLVVLAMPLAEYASLDPRSVRGKVVIDATNHDPAHDGRIPALAQSASSSSMIQRHLRGTPVVKTLNHIASADLEADSALGTPSRTRRALAVIGGDDRARAQAARFVERLGFDTVEVDSLAGAWMVQPGAATFQRGSIAGAFQPGSTPNSASGRRGFELKGVATRCIKPRSRATSGTWRACTGLHSASHLTVDPGRSDLFLPEPGRCARGPGRPLHP
jgi:predicted dinucleotide-binding enzyme